MSNELEVSKTRSAVVDNSEFANWLDTARFEHIWRVAKLFAATEVVPKAFQQKPNDCMVIIQMALRCGVDPMMFLQNSYMNQGKPNIETKLAIAMLLNSGRIRGTISYAFEGEGKTLSCTASCVLASTGEIVEHTLTWAIVESNKWHDNAFWKKDPMLMLQYRSVWRLIKTHFPDVLLGCSSKDELDDMSMGQGHVVQPRRSAGRLNALLPPALEPPKAEQGDAWEPDEEERAAIEGQLFETRPNAQEE
jgi:hypothetical protein